MPSEQHDETGWQILEKLILTQAVYKLGNDDWNGVSRILKTHPLLTRKDKDLFSPKNCSNQFCEMISEIPESSEMPAIVKLARKLHLERIDEIKRELKNDEQKIIQLLKEMRNEKTEVPVEKEATPMEAASTNGNEDQDNSNMAQSESADVIMADASSLADEAKEESVEVQTEVASQVSAADVISSNGSSTVEKKRRPSPSDDSEDPEAKKKDERWKNWRKTAMMIWHKLADHKYGNVFMNSARQETLPDYKDIVKKPMSLLAIKNRIRDGEIKTTQEFYRDVLLVFTNAIMYNPEGSEIHKMAQEIKASAEAEFRNIISYDKEYLDRRKSIMSGDSSTDHE